MGAKEILAGMVAFIIIMVWQFRSNKLGRQLKNIVIIVVDIIAVLVFYMSKVGFDRKILSIFALFMACLSWIFLVNRIRNKTDITLQDLKESRLDDMCFCMGVMLIIVF